MRGAFAGEGGTAKTLVGLMHHDEADDGTSSLDWLLF